MSAPTVFCVTDFWFPKLGGMERSIENLCRSLPPAFDVHVLTRRVPEEGGDDFPFPVLAFPVQARHGFYPEALAWIQAVRGPRVVHVFGFSYLWPETQVEFLQRVAVL